MADMNAVRDLAKAHRLWVIEDAAQALGATLEGRPAGSMCDFGTFSFFPTKNLGACGDAGMVLTSDGALAERLQRLRNHGARVKYDHEEVAYNSRLDEMQAAILRIKSSCSCLVSLRFN